MNDKYAIKNILLDGNHLCLNFINTIHNRQVEKPIDYLQDQATWVAWLGKVALKEKLETNNASYFNLEEVVALRELLYRLVIRLINRVECEKKDISEFNQHLLHLRKATKFSISNGHSLETILIDEQNLNSYLLHIVKAAHELFLFEEVNHIKACGNCGWLFLDTSKSNRRKWCNMKTCGNEVKARRHYQKVKKEKA